MHNNITLLHILRSNLKRYFLLILTLITSSIVMGQNLNEANIPITSIFGYPGQVDNNHPMSNLKDGKEGTTFSGKRDDSFSILEYMQIKGDDSYNTDTGKRSWIEIPYIPNANSEIEVVFEANGSTDWKTEYIFGNGNLFDPGISFGLLRKAENEGGSLGNFYLYSNGSRHDKTVSDFTGKHTLVYSPTSMQLDNGSIESIDNINLNTSNNLCFFYNPYAGWDGARCFRGKIYSVKIRENDKILYDLVPCHAWGRYGFYDRISGNPYFFFDIVDYIQNNASTTANNAQNNIFIKVPYTLSMDNTKQEIVWTNNLVTNGDFSNNTISSFGFVKNAWLPKIFTNTDKKDSNWWNTSDETTKPTRAIQVVNSGNSGAQSWDCQFRLLFDENKQMNQGESYTITFWCKADKQATINTQFQTSSGGYYNYGTDITVETTWKKFTLNGTVPNPNTGGDVCKAYGFLLNNFKEQNTYYFSNISVQVNGKNILTNGDLSDVTNLSPFGEVKNAWSDQIITVEGKKCIQVVNNGIQSSDPQNWDCQFRMNISEAMNEGDEYYVSYSIMAANEADIDVQLQQSGGGYYANIPQIHATTSWQKIIQTGTVGAHDGSVNAIGLMLNTSRAANTYYITDIVIKKGTKKTQQIPATEVEIQYQCTQSTESQQLRRHIFTYGTYEQGIMGLSTRYYNRYIYRSGQKDEETTIKIDANKNSVVGKLQEWDLNADQYVVSGTPTWVQGSAFYFMGTEYTTESNKNLAASFWGRMYGAVVRDKKGGDARLNLVPARNGDGIYGLYDKVNHVFYTKDAKSNTNANFIGAAVPDHGAGLTQVDLIRPFTFTFDIDNPKVVKNFYITTIPESYQITQKNESPKKWTLYGSSGDSKWTELYNYNGEPLQYGKEHRFYINNENIEYKRFRLVVERLGDDNNQIHLAELALTSIFDFEHYHGIVYDKAPNEIPENLRVGGSSRYQSDMKTRNDDPRLDSNVQIQRTHEYEHVIYVLPGTKVDLTPFSDFDYADVTNDNSYNNSYNYQEVYIRWYNYMNDKYSDKLSFDKRNGHSVNLLEDGHFAWNRGGYNNFRTREGALAHYTTDNNPTYKYGNDVIDVIAIEAANVFDWNDAVWDNSKNAYVVKEPTLQWRHLFVIKDASTRADEMHKNNTDYIKNNKITLMCPANTPFQYPLPCFEYTGSGTDHPTDFYKKNGDNNYTPIQHYLIETINNGKKGTTYLDFSSGSAVVKKLEGTLDMDQLAYSFKEKDKYNRVFYLQNPKYDTETNEYGEYTINIYEYDNTNTASEGKGKGLKLMQYDLRVLPPKDGVMVNESELKTNSNLAHQIPAKMTELFGDPTTIVDFDNIIPEQTRKAPTTDNSCKNPELPASGRYLIWPWQWENSSYGFGYEDRGDYNMYMVADHMSITPFHGRNGDDPNYETFHNVYDRKYYDNGEDPNTKGYFFYANAASDPSRMATLNIGKDFCPNTKVYVSAWINEFQGKDLYAETANVIFSFRGVDEYGNETVLNSFVSGYVTGGWNTLDGYLPKTQEKDADNKTIDVLHHRNGIDGEINNPDNRGKWMHVYYTFSTDEKAEGFDHYIITLENNCTSSEGADYAIDDIRAYICKPDMKARLMKPVCNGEQGTQLEIYGNYTQLHDAFFPETTTDTDVKFKYCFLDKETFENKKNEGKTIDEAFNAALQKNVYGEESNQNYGIITLNAIYTNNGPYSEDYMNNTSYNEYYVGHRQDLDAIKNIIFPCKATDVMIQAGRTYILALQRDGSEFDLSNKCNSSSEFTIPKPAIIKIDGDVQAVQGGDSYCANQRPKVEIDLNGVKIGGDPVTNDEVMFDWYYGPMTLETEQKNQGYNRAYMTEEKTLENNSKLKLSVAMIHFREKNPTADNDLVLGATADNYNGIKVEDGFTEDMLLFIKELVQEGHLTLYKDKGFATANIFGENLDPATQKYFYITALPIDPSMENVVFCLDPINVSIKINELTPTMKDGAGQVSYPETMRDVPLRIGLNQLKKTIINNLSSTTAPNELLVPLRAITPVTEEGKAPGTTLTKSEDDWLYLVDSNDPLASSNESGAQIFVDTTDPDKNYYSSRVVVIGKVIDIAAVTGDTNHSSNVCKLAFLKDFKFREGYWYTVKMLFKQEGASNVVCPGDLIFTIKVVPEYQMWTGAISRNWNDDRNWRRVTKEDLLWKLNNADVKSSDFLTANADYITDGGTNDRTFSYAPADFTKVIIPAGVERVPYMYDMRTGNTSVTYAGAPKGGPQIANGDPTDDTTIGKPTENVIYDMTSIDRSDNDVATRPWYDHTCDQIHFNAGAILMDQRYLYYNKAWCDIDVPVGTWQTVASPLMNIVAGDLYLPTATARQQTPLFEDIRYDTDLNDRFKPAVFQRSWNKSMAKVYKLDGNMDNVGIKLDWSHVYNDVNVRYGAGQGFSIKVDVSAMPESKQPGKNGNPDKARFRFPKADKQYTYYNPGNTDGDKKTESVNSEDMDIIGGVRPGKLSDLSGTFQQMVGDTGNNQNPATPTNYFLVGNPLICWLNMQKFFDNNTQFERKYWIASADGQRTALFSETEGWVSTLNGDAQFLAPGVSFFVELKQGQEDATSQVASPQNNVTPQFTADMMSYVQGEKSPTTNNDGSNPNSRAAEQSYIPQLRLTAEDGNGRKSVAMLTDGTVAEHDMVETLFDSNLKDDIFLYTTKNGQAQSIANIVPGDTLPLVTAGLVDDVMLHIEGAEYFDCPLYIIDSEEGTIEPLTSDITLNCSTRGVRYYITSPGEKEEEMTISAPRVTAGSGRITIYAPANAAIEWAEIHSTNGTLVEKENDIDYSYSAILPSAIYLVRLSVEGHVYTYKLLLTDK